MHFVKQLRCLECSHGRVGTDGTDHHHLLHWQRHPYIHLRLCSLHQASQGRKAQPAHCATCRREVFTTATPNPVYPASILMSTPQCALTVGVAHSSGLNCLHTARIRRWTIVFHILVRRVTAWIRADGNGNRIGRFWAMLHALPDQSLAKKYKRGFEALEFRDAGYIGKRIDRAMGVVGSWSKM